MCILMILLALKPLSLSLQDHTTLHQAEQAFQQGRDHADNPSRARAFFRQAATHYADLVNRGFRNADLLRNLGNSHLLADELPQAILSYRRGLRVAPNDWAMRQNLAHARSQVAYPAGDLGHPPADPLPPWLPRIGSGPGFAVALLAYLAACVAFTRWRMTRNRRLFLVGGALLVIAVSAGGLGAWLSWGEWEEARHPLVVIAEDGVLLRSGNGLSYPPRYATPLNRGVEARRLLQRGDWLKIELGGGETGWVRAEWVLADEPSR